MYGAPATPSATGARRSSPSSSTARAEPALSALIADRPRCRFLVARACKAIECRLQSHRVGIDEHARDPTPLQLDRVDAVIDGAYAVRARIAFVPLGNH